MRAPPDPTPESTREPQRRRFLGPPRSYVVTRFALLRLLGVVYFVAFVVAYQQMVPLVGQHGLLPAETFLARVVHHFGSPMGAFRRLPTLLVWLGAGDGTLMLFAALGAGLSLAVVFGATNALVQLGLWILYLSLSKVGQIFYGYGWEIQLLETGFLSIFLCPVRTIRPFSGKPPVVTIVLFRWLIARIMLGAGLIKWRGDPCWTDLTCLVYHYETQPIPGPSSHLFHALPRGVHAAGVLFNHLVELVLPFFAFGPRRARLVAGALFIAFQCTLIVSGNLSFLNWLTIVPAIACFDDDALVSLVPRRARAWLAAKTPSEPSRAHSMAAAVWAAFVAALSVSPVMNLLSPRQTMNTTFEPLGLVNTYGAFGSVDRERRELVLEGTASEARDPRAEWHEYEFPCKPGDVHRSSCLVTPYHHRMDWQMWFAAKSRIENQPWLARLVDGVLRGEKSVNAFFVKNPFPDKPPRYMRILAYRYRFARSGDALWERELIGEWMRPVSAGDPGLVRLLAAHGLARD